MVLWTGEDTDSLPCLWHFYSLLSTFSPPSAHIYFPFFLSLLLLFHTFGAHFFSCLPACTVLQQCFHCSIIILLITQKKFCLEQKKNSFFVMSQLQQQPNLDTVITIHKSEDGF